MSNDLILPPSGDLTTMPRGGKGKSIASIEATLRPHAEAFNMARWCEKVRGGAVIGDGISSGESLPWDFNYSWSSLGNVAVEHRVKAIETAKRIRRLLLPAAIKINEAIMQYIRFVNPNPEDNISAGEAAAMVKGLVNAIAGKKRSEEDQAKLDAMLLMFNPTINDIGEATKLWGEVPRHSVVVSLAIMSMMYKTQTFCPAPLELADACRKARNSLRGQLHSMEHVINMLSRAEEVIFEFARDDWASLYTTKQMAEEVPGYINSFDGDNQEKFAEWCDALTEIEHEMIFKIIRKGIGTGANGVKAKVKEGDVVPEGITPQPIPSELVKEIPGFANLQYFLTTQQIAIVEGDKIAEVIKR